MLCDICMRYGRSVHYSTLSLGRYKNRIWYQYFGERAIKRFRENARKGRTKRMKCSVLGCDEEATNEPEGSDEFKLCPEHWSRWRDFHAGYLDGHYGNSDRHGRLNRKLWRKAMLAFLKHCRVEIIALKELGISRDTRLEEIYARID